jgi:hypothetical protein
MMEEENSADITAVVAIYHGMKREDAFKVAFGGDGTPPPGIEIIELENAVPPLDPETFAPVAPYDWSALSESEYAAELKREIARVRSLG